jgi:hypothetical protein
MLAAPQSSAPHPFALFAKGWETTIAVHSIRGSGLTAAFPFHLKAAMLRAQRKAI